jgi:hypothetical protein
VFFCCIAICGKSDNDVGIEYSMLYSFTQLTSAVIVRKYAQFIFTNAHTA